MQNNYYSGITFNTDLLDKYMSCKLNQNPENSVKRKRNPEDFDKKFEEWRENLSKREK